MWYTKQGGVDYSQIATFFLFAVISLDFLVFFVQCKVKENGVWWDVLEV